jgi:hypothetical protein
MAKMQTPSPDKKKDGNVASDVAPLTAEEVAATDIANLQRQIAQLENLVRSTGNQNKIRKYERENGREKMFSFAIGLFPSEAAGGKYVPVLSWTNMRRQDNLVDRTTGMPLNQVMTVTLAGENEPVRVSIEDWHNLMVQTDPIKAERILNHDGTEMQVRDKIIENGNGQSFPVLSMEPNRSTTESGKFSVEIAYEGETYVIENTFLNPR